MSHIASLYKYLSRSALVEIVEEQLSNVCTDTRIDGQLKGSKQKKKVMYRRVLTTAMIIEISRLKHCKGRASDVRSTRYAEKKSLQLYILFTRLTAHLILRCSPRPESLCIHYVLSDYLGYGARTIVELINLA